MQESSSAKGARVFASVLAYGSYTVGASNNTTGVFWKYALDTTWRHIGPSNLKAFSVVTGQGKGVIIVAAGNGIHRSTDDGETWRQVTDWQVRDVTHITRVDSRTFYAGSAYGMMRSTDDGITWFGCNIGLPLIAFVTGIATASDGRVWYTTENGVYRSTEDVPQWHALPLAGHRFRCIARSPGGRLAVATEEGRIFLSTDDGASWIERSKGLPGDPVYTIAFNPVQEEVIWCGGVTGEVYKSADAGKTWLHAGAVLERKPVHSIAVDPLSGMILAGTTGGGVYESSDGGVTWRQAGLRGANVWSVSVEGL